jgi:hypothetical protein
MELNGGKVSTVQLNEIGDDLILPTLSLENIFKLWEPSLRETNSRGVAHVTKLELSMLHSNLSIPTPLFSLPPLSVAENSKTTAFEEVLPPFLMDEPFASDMEINEVRGGMVSTVQLNDASEMSLFPTLSRALVSMECIPSVRLSIRSGLSHVTNFDLSKLHSKWLRPTPLSVPENSNQAVVDEELPPVIIEDRLPFVTLFIEVSGATVSTVQLKEAGEVSIFPTPS